MSAPTSARGNPRRRPLLRLAASDERQVLTDPADGREHVLNPTALALWELCDGATRPDEMIAGVSELFAVSHAQAAADVQRTLAEFERVGLIDWVRVGQHAAAQGER